MIFFKYKTLEGISSVIFKHQYNFPYMHESTVVMKKAHFDVLVLPANSSAECVWCSASL